MADEKKAFRINIIDVLITLVIIAVVSVGVLMLANAFDVNASDDGTVAVEYTVQFKRIRDEFSDNIHVGDAVIDAQKRHNLGTVTKVSNEPYTVELYNHETDMRDIVEYPDFITINMKVSAAAYVSDEMCYLKDSGKEIGIGTALYIHLPDFCGMGYICEMKVSG